MKEDLDIGTWLMIAGIILFVYFLFIQIIDEIIITPLQKIIISVLKWVIEKFE